MKKNNCFNCFSPLALTVGVLLLFSFTLCNCKEKECPLTNASGSPEELALRFLTALENHDTTGMWSLKVTKEEYIEILWPPYQEKGYAGPPEFKWSLNWMDGVKAVKRAMFDYGGVKLKLVRVYFAKGQDEQVGPFKIWRDFRMVVTLPSGEETELKYINTVVEMYGAYKAVALHS